MSFASPFNLSTLNGTNGFRLDGGAADDRSGYSVASAGDVNGDGFADILVGAYLADPNGMSSAGATYVVFGKAGGWTGTVSLSGLNGADGFRLDGSTSTTSGYSVASAGDVNGDGFSDIIVGAYFAAPNGLSTAGSSFVVFGRAAGWSPTLSLATLDGTSGFRLDGAATNDRSGIAVASAGDVNGDGFADLLVGADRADPNGASNAGSSYLVFGQASGWASTVALGTLNGTNGLRLDGVAADEWSGASVASAGDINGDGFADIIIGANAAAPNGVVNAGSSYVVFGQAGGWNATLGLATLNGTNGFRLDGIAANDRSGISVASAGDFNGDGFGDLIVGGHFVDINGNSSAGAAYVVFGRGGAWTPTVSLATLDGTNGFRLGGQMPQDWAGVSVASAGDVNGDGFADLLVGAQQADPNGASNAGSTYLVFGRAGDWTPTVALSSLSGTVGVRLDGVAAADVSGASVASAGDVDGDGFSDIIIGASQADPNGVTGAGSSYVVLSPATGGALARGTSLAETLRGTAEADRMFGFGQNDTIFGNAGDDTIEGGAGNDTLNGGGGNDTLSYAGAAGGVVLALAFGTPQNTGGAGTDTVAGFENILGSAFDDTLTGTSGPNTMEGGAGNDVLSGGGDNDTASYAGATSGVFVSLAFATPQNTFGAGTDTLSGFENLLGSAFGDTLTGNSGVNTLTGGAGNDVLAGGAANDVLAGGAGSDTALYSQTRASYTITKNILAGWTVSANDASGNDVLTSIERLAFSDQSLNLGFARGEDMAGRGFGDVLFQNVSGGWLYRWQMEGTTRNAEGALGGPGANWVVAGKGDFNADLNADLLWRNTTTGELYVWLMNGASRIGEGSAGLLAAGQSVGGVGDTDGDGRADIVLRGADGSWAVQRMFGTTTVSTAGGTLDAAWSVAAVADFNGDLRADVLWRNGTTGQLFLWRMDGSTVAAQNSYATPGTAFVVAGTGDLNGDGRADVVIRHGTENWFWGYLTAPISVAAGTNGWLGGEGNGYALARIADYTGDDMADLLFYDAANGFAWLQAQNGLTLASSGGAGVAGAGFAIL